METTPARLAPDGDVGGPTDELRRGFAAGAALVGVVPAAVAGVFGGAWLGLVVLVASTGLAAFAWLHLVRPHLADADERLSDARYRLDDAERRAADGETQLARARAREVEASRLALVAQRTASGVLITDEVGRIEWVNDAFTRITGYTLEEAAGATPGELLRSERTDADTSRIMGDAVRAGESHSCEIWNRAKDGRDYLVAIEIEPLRSDTGDLIGFMGLEVDVTTERALAEQVKDSEARMRGLLESTKVIVWEFDPAADVFTYVSPQVERLGYPEERWYEPGFFREIVHDDDFADAMASCRAATAQGKDHELRYRMVCADGEVLWIRDLVKVVETPDRGVILRGVLVDFTAQKEVEEELAELTEHTRVEAERLELALAGGDIGFWDWRPQSGGLVVNDRWAEMIGRSVDELALDTSDWEGNLHPDDREATFEALEAHFNGETEIYEATFRLRHAKGHWVWILGRGKVVDRDAAGAPLRIVGIQIDRTREVERSLELDHLREKAELASRSKSEFLANVSHEIRTPLTAILGYADILREDGDLERAPRRRVEMLDTIQNAGRHLLTLINDILDLSKIEANRMTVEQLEFNLPELLVEVTSLIRPRVLEKGLELRVEVDGAIPSIVTSDPTRLRQILVNLLGNAEKFTEEGHVEMRVGVRDGARVAIEIEDTGTGMTEDQIEQLFRPFVQADGTVTRRFGGTGLGLTISRRLAKLMDGTVRLVRTAPGAGSVFAVEIPLLTPEDVPYVEELATPGDDDGADEVTQRLDGRILLVEDGAVNQRIFATMLGRAGARVDVADDGEQALDRVDAASQDGWSYDLIVSDMQMPRMDGYTFARTLRDRGDQTPIIALTAHAMAEDRDRCIAAGCDDFIVKPATRRGLISACAYWLRGAGHEAA